MTNICLCSGLPILWNKAPLVARSHIWIKQYHSTDHVIKKIQLLITNNIETNLQNTHIADLKEFILNLEYMRIITEDVNKSRKGDPPTTGNAIRIHGPVITRLY
jgi:hypothetical protein